VCLAWIIEADLPWDGFQNVLKVLRATPKGPRDVPQRRDQVPNSSSEKSPPVNPALQLAETWGLARKAYPFTFKDHKNRIMKALVAI